jgi:MFS family permease
VDGRTRLLTPAFLLVQLATLALFLAIGVLLPTLPRYAEGPLGAGTVAIGVAVGAASVTSLLAQPVVGRLADRRGRRQLLVAGAALASASTAAYTVVGSIEALVGLRLVTGVGEAMFFVAAATAVTDLAPPGRRGEAVSLFTLASYSGLAVGPLLGELLLDGDRYDTVFLTAAVFVGCAALVGLLVPETRPDAATPAQRPPLINRAALRPGLILLAGLFSFGGFNAFMALYALEVGLGGAGPLFLVFAVVVVAVRSVGRRLPDRLGPRRAASISLATLALGSLILGVWQAPVGLYAGTAVFAFGQALAYPALLTLALREASDSERSSVVGTVTAFVDVAIALGAVALGAVAAVTSYGGAFVTASAVALVGLLALQRMKPAPDASAA